MQWAKVDVERLRAVYQLTDAVGRAGALEGIYDAALDCLVATLGADRASVLLFDAEGVMRFVAWRGLSDGYRAAVEGHSPWQKDAAGVAPIACADVLEDEALAPLRDVITREGIRALAFVPLVYAGRLLGKFMVYFDAPHAFDDDELDLAQTIAGHVAFAVERRRAEDKLTLYREIFRHSSEAIAIVDASGEYVEQNAAHESLVGYSDDELRGRTPAIHLGDEVFARVAQDLSGSGLHLSEVRSRTKSGTIRDIELSAFAIREPSGEPAYFVGIKRDIGNRKRGEAALRLLAEASAVLDASLDFSATLCNVGRVAVPHLATWCVVDVEIASESRRVVVRADRAEPLLSIPRGSTPFVPVADGQVESIDRVSDELKQRLASEPATADACASLGAASIVAVPLRSGESMRGTMTLVRGDEMPGFRDDEIALARDLAKRAAIALENARLHRETQEGDRRKDEFLAMLAHELRNPLAPMLTAVELMQMAEGNPATGARAREVIARQVRHMTRLVDDLLDVSRITRGKIELRRERIDVADTVYRALETMRPIVEQRRHDLRMTIAPELWAHADPVRVEQIVANLVHNAAKYTEPGGNIAITAARDGDEVVLRVRDDGVGISADLLERVFEPFMQGHRGPDRSQGGLGIGLTLVKRLAELHGGSVAAHSEGAGRGTEIVVRLPAAR